MKPKWYETNKGIVLSLFIFLPVGLYLMWKHATWRKGVKIGITVMFVFFILMGKISSDSESKQISNNPSPTPTIEKKIEPTEAPKNVEKMKVEVTSQIVKKVGKKNRYFFLIQNSDTKPFEGKVSITLFNEKQKTALGGETFNTSQPIQPTIGNSVNFDINTGTTSEYGEFRITRFKYSVKVNDVEINNGEGAISDKFEDLSL